MTILDSIPDVVYSGCFAAVAAIGFAAISNPPRRAILLSGVLASVGYGMRVCLLDTTTIDLISATFVAAITIGMLSILLGMIVRCPAEVFSFPSLLPMIPGKFAYTSLLLLLKFVQSNDTNESIALLIGSVKNISLALFILLALVIGVTVPMIIFSKQAYQMTRRVK